MMRAGTKGLSLLIILNHDRSAIPLAEFLCRTGHRLLAEGLSIHFRPEFAYSAAMQSAAPGSPTVLIGR